MNDIRTARRRRRPGGNFTHPHFDIASGRTHYQVYVKWELVVDCVGSCQAAEHMLRERTLDGGTVTIDDYDVMERPDPTGVEIEAEIARTGAGAL
jgi:hypothetical protein